MALKDALLPEFDQEMANTRKTLERVPDDKMDWTPHAKSFTMGKLATHVARLPEWGKITLATESLDYMKEPPGAPFQTSAEVLAGFDKLVAECRAAIAGASDEEMFKDWTLLAGGQHIFSMPRIAVLRSFVMNHIIHHRAQLGVYLRLNDIPVPGVYGPSADEM